MSDDLTSAIGAAIFIGPKANTAATLAEYDALSGWMEIAVVESFPALGVNYEIGSFTPVKTGAKRKYKGARDDGDLGLSCAFIEDDAGQAAVLAAAEDAQGTYPFKVVLGNDPGGTGSKPTRRYFRGLVTSAQLVPGKTGDPVKLDFKVAIDGGVVRGEAVAGS